MAVRWPKLKQTRLLLSLSVSVSPGGEEGKFWVGGSIETKLGAKDQFSTLCKILGPRNYQIYEMFNFFTGMEVSFYGSFSPFGLD